MTGVYCIINLTNSKRYVGSTTKSFSRRKSEHFSLLKKDKHPNKKLQNAWIKYGEDNFIFEKIEECLPENCIEAEQKWIDIFDSCKSGYNIRPKAENWLGHRHSQETISKLKKIDRSYSRPGKRREIVQYDKQMNKLAEYSSVNEANQKTGVSLATLQRILHNQTNPKKFIFKYKEEII